MKHVALSLLAVACGALSASALDASNARIWLDEKIQPEFAPVGQGIASEKLGTNPTFARTWQYVSIPLHVEGVAKGDSQPNYIPELKLRISLAVVTADEKGKPTDSPELLTKEITYTDIPLTKGKKPNMGESVVNVGVFVSPSNAYKLSAKDGNLAKKIIAVAVEGTFQGSACNRVKEKANDSVATGVVVDSKIGKGLAEGWWTKKSGNSSGAKLSAISETPFAADYARMGFPPTSPLFGAVSSAPSAPSAPASAAAEEAPSAGPSRGVGPSSSPSVGPSSNSAYPLPGGSSSDADSDGGDSSSSADEDSKGKKGKKGKKNRR